MTKQQARKELQKLLKKALGFAPSQDQIEIVECNFDGKFIKGKISAEFGDLIVTFDSCTLQLKNIYNSTLWF